MIGVVRVDGGEGRALSFVGEVMTLTLARAYAPGQPMRCTVVIGDREMALDGRSVGSRKTPDGAFEVRVRLVNLRREDRDALRAATSRASVSGR